MPDRRGEDNERLSIESPSCHTHRRSHLPKRTTRRAGATGKLLSKLLAIGEREQTENNRFPINKHRRIWLSYRGGGTDSDPHDRYLPKRESGNPASHDVLFLRDTTNRFIRKRWNKLQLTSRNVETPLLAFVLDIATIRPAQITKHGGKHHFQAVLINI